MQSFAALRRWLARAVVVLILSLALGTLVAMAGNGFYVDDTEADGQHAVASENENRDGSGDLECDSGEYAWQIMVGGEHWGTYPSISSVALGCLSPGEVPYSEYNNYDTETDWVELGIYSPPRGWSACATGERVALIGLKVNYDRYIKDFKQRCGRIRVSSESVTVDDAGYSGGWLLDRVEDDDSARDLKCDGDRVVTGLRLRYRKDSNEYAFTSVRLLCARLAVPPSRTDTTSSDRDRSRTRTTPTRTATTPTRTATTPNGSIVVAVVEPSVSCAVPVPGSKPLGRGSSWHCTFSGSATTSFGRARANGRIEMKTSRSGITTVQGRLTLGYGGAKGRTTISLLLVRAGTSSTVVNVESPPGSWRLGPGSGDWSGATGKGTYLLALNFESTARLALHLEGSVKSASR